MGSQLRMGFIGGGQMAEALIRGIIDADLISKDNLSVIDVSGERLQYLHRHYGVATCLDPKEICTEADVLLLALKPQVIGQVHSLYSQFINESHLVISIMAGVAISDLEQYFPGAKRFVRVMPNTPALILEGATAYSGNTAVSSDDMSLAQSIFSAVGYSVEVQEYLLDAVTGLSGSGPGYIFTIIDGLIDGGVYAGLPRDIARKLVLQTMYGSVKLAMESDKNAAELKAQVTSPGGTTIHGIHALEKGGLRSILMDGVMQATRRSKELGK